MNKAYSSKRPRTCLDPDITFVYQKPEENDGEKYETIKAGFKELAHLILEICPDNREREDAYFMLQTAMTKASASVAVDRGVKNYEFSTTKQQECKSGEES